MPEEELKSRLESKVKSRINFCHLMALLLELSTFPAGLRNFSYLQPAISARAGVYNAI